MSRIVVYGYPLLEYWLPSLFFEKMGDTIEYENIASGIHNERSCSIVIIFYEV